MRQTNKTQTFCPSGLTAIDDTNIFGAVDAWLTDPVGAEAVYGHIKWWDTGMVTDMSCLFGNPDFIQCSWRGTPPGLAIFNDDLAHW